MLKTLCSYDMGVWREERDRRAKGTPDEEARNRRRRLSTRGGGKAAAPPGSTQKQRLKLRAGCSRLEREKYRSEKEGKKKKE